MLLYPSPACQKRSKTCLKNPFYLFITFAGACYLSFVFVGRELLAAWYDQLVTGQLVIPAFIYGIIAFLSLVIAFLFLLYIARFGKAVFRVNESKDKLSLPLFLFVFLVVLTIYLLLWIGNYPGGINPDTTNQWTQIHNMKFKDHHPVFHTFLLGLMTLVWDSYTFFILVQLILFALGMAYLCVTLQAWGIPKWCNFFIVYICVFGDLSQYVFMYAVKDTALSLFFLFLLPSLINIFLTNGEWLKKTSHWITCALLLAGITLVRHNAILFTAPLVGLGLIYFRKYYKVWLKVAVVTILIIGGIKGPVYALFNVTPATSTYREIIGLPMTILSTTYATQPQEQLPEGVYDFLSQYADQETFKKKYTFGNYNSVKDSLGFRTENFNTSNPTPQALAKMTMETLKMYPEQSFLAIAELTDMVWDPLTNEGSYKLKVPKGSDIQMNVAPIDSQVVNIFSAFSSIIKNRSGGNLILALSSRFGLLNLILLLCWYVSLCKIHGWKSLWLAAPVILYNFGTMLLLCGNDIRFFHFSCLATYPLAFLLLCAPNRAPAAQEQKS